MNNLPLLSKLQWKTSSKKDYMQYGFLLTDNAEIVVIASTRGSSDFTDSATIDAGAVHTKDLLTIGRLLYERSSSGELT